MSALGTVTARCVHCMWRTDLEGDGLAQARDLHELMHPGGTVLVGDADRTADMRTGPNGSKARASREPWSRERAIAAIQRFHREHGRTPRQPELRAADGLPSNGSLTKLFGSMGDAIRAAGFEPRPKGGARRSSSGSSPSHEAKKREAVPPRVAEPERVGRQPVDTSDDDSAHTLVGLAQVVDTLSTRRRDMLAELDALDQELRDAIDACGEALAAVEVAA